MKLLLDEHYADEIAAALRRDGFDAVTVPERGLKGLSDPALFALAAAEGRALLTNNARDFLPLLTRWASSGDPHSGLLLTSDASMPRAKNNVAVYVQVLAALMAEHPSAHAFADRVRWLP